jgi:hypothetical protein
VFRRRRSADAGQDWSEDTELDNDEPIDEPSAGRSPAGTPRAEGGPWDAGEAYPEQERVDLGSLRVPVGPEHEIQLVMAEQLGAWVTVKYLQSELQIQAFAAARRDALWDDVRAEIAAEVTAAGGRSEESQGSFGTELMAHVLMEPGQPASGSQQVRFAGLLEEVLGDTVVVRGEHPVPPRDILELRLPPEARQALEEQAAAAAAAEEENRFRTDLNPFDRGPEFTETR